MLDLGHPLQRQLQAMIARQFETRMRRKRIEKQIWSLEAGIPIVAADHGNRQAVPRAAAREKLQRELYDVTVELMRLSSCISHLYREMREVKSSPTYRAMWDNDEGAR